MNNQDDILKYYSIVLQVYRKLEKNIYPKDFGTKQNWEREFEPTKYNDKNLKAYVNYLIEKGILLEKESSNGNIIYQPNENTAIMCQEEIENSSSTRLLENLGYELIRKDFNTLFRL